MAWTLFRDTIHISTDWADDVLLKFHAILLFFIIDCVHHIRRRALNTLRMCYQNKL